jgi:hypothetical protein
LSVQDEEGISLCWFSVKWRVGVPR